MRPRGGIEVRLERLEAQIPPRVDEDAALRRAVIIAVLDELASLKVSRATGYRGGVPIEPEDIPRQHLGETYTTGELHRLAIRRTFEREGVEGEKLDELVGKWTPLFRDLVARTRRDWDDLEGGG